MRLHIPVVVFALCNALPAFGNGCQERVAGAVKQWGFRIDNPKFAGGTCPEGIKQFEVALSGFQLCGGSAYSSMLLSCYTCMCWL